MTAVLKHELSGYFHSLTAYIFSAFLLAFVGIGAMLYNIQSAVANFEYVLSFVCLGFVIVIPILTMRVIAEEKKQKTDQLLYSLPIKTSEVVAGGLSYLYFWRPFALSVFIRLSLHSMGRFICLPLTDRFLHFSFWAQRLSRSGSLFLP